MARQTWHVLRKKFKNCKNKKNKNLKFFNVNDDIFKLVHMADIHGWNLVATRA